MLQETKTLITAMDASNLVMLERLLKKGASPNVSCLPIAIGTGTSARTVEIDATPLMLSSANDNIAVMKLLLKYGADANAASQADGDTPLHWAARNGNFGAVRVLLEHNADLNRKNNNGETPSALALANLHHNTVELLNNFSTNHTTRKRLGLSNNQATADYYHPEYMQQLINNLTYAAANGVAERVKAILAQGAPVDGKNDNGCTSLYAAAHAGHLDIIKLLASYGSDVDVHSASGFTALIVACDRNHFQVANFLIRQGADVNALDYENTTALLFATAHSQLGMVKLLLENRADPNVISDRGNLPLCVAAFYQQTEIIDLLLKHGANPNLIGYDGFSALAIASVQGHETNVKLLLKHPSNPNFKSNEGRTPLALAAGAGALDVMKLLVDKGADINLADDLGCSALMYAAATEKIESTKMLLYAGADTQMKDKKGQTALSLAKTLGHDDIAKVLQNGLSDVQISPVQAPTTKEKIKIPPNHDSEASQEPDLEDLQKELDALTGMSNIKANVVQLTNFLKFQKMRQEKGFSSPDQSLHMVFTGNPGTGKTTIARLIAKIYKSLGVLSKGQFVETDRADLVAGYLGQTAIKVREVVEKSLGGVLFIDEAYSLTISEAGRDEFGYEAVNTLLKLMEDHRDDLIVIVAGYTEPMQKFIKSNPGLQSRFNKFLHFDDYAPSELTEIFRHFAVQGDYQLHPATELKLHNVFAELYAGRDETFGNARLARNIFEKAINAHANRMVSAGAVDEVSLVTLYPDDVLDTRISGE